MAIPIRTVDGVKEYQCCNCGHWFGIDPKTVGAVGNNGIYCPSCANALFRVECGIWENSICKNHALPSQLESAQVRHIVWQPIERR